MNRSNGKHRNPRITKFDSRKFNNEIERADADGFFNIESVSRIHRLHRKRKEMPSCAPVFDVWWQIRLYSTHSAGKHDNQFQIKRLDGAIWQYFDRWQWNFLRGKNLLSVMRVHRRPFRYPWSAWTSGDDDEISVFVKRLISITHRRRWILMGSKQLRHLK